MYSERLAKVHHSIRSHICYLFMFLVEVLDKISIFNLRVVDQWQRVDDLKRTMICTTNDNRGSIIKANKKQLEQSQS